MALLSLLIQLDRQGLELTTNRSKPTMTPSSEHDGTLAVFFSVSPDLCS